MQACTFGRSCKIECGGLFAGVKESPGTKRTKLSSAPAGAARPCNFKSAPELERLGLVLSATRNAFGAGGNPPASLLWTQSTNSFSGLPHLGIADGGKFFSQLNLIIRFAAGGEDAGAFLAVLHALIEFFEDRQDGLQRT